MFISCSVMLWQKYIHLKNNLALWETGYPWRLKFGWFPYLKQKKSFVLPWGSDLGDDGVSVYSLKFFNNF